jgi:glycosyltransferase involved in cell wall biosynthesis
MFHLLKRLAGNYSITLITFMETEDEKEFLPELEALCEKVIAVRRAPPRRWQPFPYEPFEAFRTPEMEQALDRCLEEADYKLVQMEYNQMARYADRIGRIPKLLTKHEVDFAACARRAKLESNPLAKARWFYNYLQVLDRETELTRKADAVICLTDVDAEALGRFCPSVPVHVIPTGVDLEYFRPPDRPPEAPRLVFVGAFQHWPNVDAMHYFCRQVLPLVRAQRPDVELLIVGSRPTPRVTSLSEIPGVTVTGWVPDIRPFMARSSVYVVPVRLGMGLRGKVLEAWSMRMPVVSTSVGCAGLRREHGGNILVADSAAEFASHIVSLFADPSLRQKLGEEGRKTAERYYGWERAAQQLDALYRDYLD